MTSDLSEGRVQALQALISSIAPDASTRDADSQNDLMQRLSQKIDQLGLGDKLGGEEGSSQSLRQNEKGQLLNEEGLPIIDITEDLIDETGVTTSGSSAVVSDDPPAVPLRLPSVEKEKRLAWRNKILDDLEAEEVLEEQRETARERQELATRDRKRREEAQSAADARKLQKKMGKALFQSSPNSPAPETTKTATATTSPPISSDKKKSVSFAEADRSPEEEENSRIDWGDVVPAKLRPPPRQPPAQAATMKSHVVERVPGSSAKPNVTPSHPQPRIATLTTSVGDSDDESEKDSDGPDPLDDSDSSHGLLSSDEDGDEDEEKEESMDWDTVQHQREIALAYLKKRETLGKDAGAAMMSHSHDEEEHGEHEWDQPDVPLEATLAHSPPKPAVSRFKADRLASHNSAGAPSSTSTTSTSLGASVLPSTSAQTNIRRAIRTGRLHGEKLVGPDSDSDREIEDPERDKVAEEAFFEMLKTGEIKNVGPDFDSSIQASTNAQAPLHSRSLGASPLKGVTERSNGLGGSKPTVPARPQPQPQGAHTKAPPSRISQFKRAHLASSLTSTSSPCDASSSVSPVSTGTSTPISSSPKAQESVKRDVQPRPAVTANGASAGAAGVPFSSVILLPSQPDVVPEPSVNLPSFVSTSNSSNPGPVPSAPTTQPSIQPLRPRPALAPTVRESIGAPSRTRGPHADASATSTDGGKDTHGARKISRFMADRI